MSSRALTLESSLASRLLAWIDERFPWANALLFFILYLTTALVARAASGEGPLVLSGFDLLGCLVTWSLFLLIRIFDEHKDYDKDLVNHPNRVLQSGLIRLSHLRVLGALAIALQLGVALGLDGGLGPVTQAWVAMFVWLCLMGKEFFCGAWLEKRLALYAFSHMLIMPLIVWWLAQMARPGVGTQPALWTLMALAFVSGFAFEITRKARAPEEPEALDSYTRIFGLGGVITVIGLLVLGMVALQGCLLVQLGGARMWPAWLVLALVPALACFSLLQFWRAPSIKGRERNEAAVGLGTLLGYFTLCIVALLAHGLELSAWH